MAEWAALRGSRLWTIPIRNVRKLSALGHVKARCRCLTQKRPGPRGIIRVWPGPESETHETEVNKESAMTFVVHLKLHSLQIYPIAWKFCRGDLFP